jgi:hypothetical protein
MTTTLLRHIEASQLTRAHVSINVSVCDRWGDVGITRRNRGLGR